MKRFFTLIALVGTLSMNAQFIEQGDLIINGGVGFGIENSTFNVEVDSNEVAAPGLLNLSAEYLMTESVGITVRLERNGYITEEEDSSRVRSVNMMIGPSFHFVNNDNHSMYVSALFGNSSMRWTSTSEDLNEDDYYVYASGFQMQFNLGGQVGIVADNLGFFYEAGYTTRKYKEITVHDEDADPVEQVWEHDNGTIFNQDDDEPVEMTLAGANFRLGLFFKF